MLSVRKFLDTAGARRGAVGHTEEDVDQAALPRHHCIPSHRNDTDDPNTF